MKIRNIILVILILSCKILAAQNYFNNTYNDFGNVYTHPTQNFQAYNRDYASTVIETLDDNYMLFGNSQDFIVYDIDSLNWYAQIVKIDQGGDTIWSKNLDISPYGKEVIFNVYECSDSSIIGVGFIADTFSNHELLDGLIVKIDKSGNYIWHQQYDFGEGHRFVNIKTKDMGQTFNLIGIADVGNTIQDYDIFYTTIDSLGNMISNYQFGGSDWDLAKDFEYLEDGNILIAGETYTDATGTLNRPDVYLMKIDSNGNLLWDQLYGYPGWDQTYSSHCLYVDDDSNGYIATTHEKSNGNFVAWLVKTDTQGDTLWTKMYDTGPFYDDFKSIYKANDGNLIIMGSSDNYNNFSSFKSVCWINKIDTNGNVIWSRKISKYPTSSQSFIYNSEMNLTDNGDILISGYLINGSIETDSIFHSNDKWFCKTDSCGFTTGVQPQANLTIDSIVNGAVHFTNLSTEYCYAIMDFGNGDSLILSAYNPNQFQNVYYYTDTGSFQIILTVNAADSSDQITIPIEIDSTIYTPFTTQLTTLNEVGCLGGNNATVALNISGGIPPYFINWNGIDTASLAAGIYNYSVSDSYNNFITDSFEINAPDSILTAEIQSNLTGNSYSLTAEVSGGVSPYYYSWNGVNFFETWSANETGTYYLTVTDSYGCITTDSIEIVITSIKHLREIENKLTLHPNPANDFVIASIHFEEYRNNPNLTLQIIDLSGRLVIETEQIIKNEKTSFKLNVSSLPFGNYIINAIIDGEIIGSASLIIRQP